MSAPVNAPASHADSKSSPPGTPAGSPRTGSPTGYHFLVPSPIPTRRTRTYSQSERARAGPLKHGLIKTFCRERGHGFIIPKDNGAPIFVHISDVDGELVPREGDEVTYKLCSMPPKFEKFCAVHVVIVNPRSDLPHERWSAGPHHNCSPSHS